MPEIKDQDRIDKQLDAIGLQITKLIVDIIENDGIDDPIIDNLLRAKNEINRAKGGR